jgi:hypothetical protein
MLLGVRESVRESSHSQMNSHFGSWSPKLPIFQRAIEGFKNHGIEDIIEKILERRCLKWAHMTHLGT